MLNEKEQLEYDVLSILREMDQPVGCGMISATLQGQGVAISEATVGRILRDFDHLGYTEKSGYQGRFLSISGKDRMNQLINRQKSLQWGADFANAMEGHTKEHLLEVLVARRVIESELAFLAATKSTQEERIALGQIVENQRRALDGGGGAAQEDVQFHALIANMARNRVLAASIDLIRQDTQLSPILEYIRKHVHSMVYIDHQKIFQAIIDGRADAAKEAMTNHVNNLIHDVEKYWESIDTDE